MPAQLPVHDQRGGVADNRPRPSRRNRVRDGIALVFGVVCVVFGVYLVWAQHTGTTADVTVLECHHVGRSDECSGQWRDGVVTRSVWIVATPLPDPGEIVPMRIHDGKAYSQSALLPLMAFGFGALMLFAAGYSVRRRRQDT